jgi:hypothetical protein|tara:strand:- start:300 stop:479 length:180 start_codon:yes stop_codon:yes gene_type:complete
MLRLVEIGIPWEVVAELSEMDLQMVAIIKASLLEADQSASNIDVDSNYSAMTNYVGGLK